MKIRHPERGSAHGLLLTFSLLLFIAGSGGFGCDEAPAGPEVAPAEALRARFPEQAAAVLAPEEAFRATPQGFALGAGSATAVRRVLGMSLPREGHGVLRLRDRDGFEVAVRELGVEDAGAGAERAVAYRRAGGTSFWSAAPGGVEEWLHLEAGAARGDAPVAVWEVEGATVRTRGESAELVDASGRVRLSVTAPRAYAAGGRAIHAWMAGRERRVELWVEAEAQEVLVDPLWTPAGMMSTVRRYHTATLLPNGQVLVVGGGAPSGLKSAELYDPATRTWKPAASLSTARFWHTSTLLPSGQVLVVGGAGPGGLTSVELYDPATNTWKPAASLNASHSQHTATLLPSGQVLVVGGYTGTYLASAELYDPATNTWKPAASLTSGRSVPTATLLPNGQLLVVGGGGDAGALASAELYNPVTNTWKPAASLSTPHAQHTATLLPGGQVLIVGGIGSGSLPTGAELYDPATDSWTPVASLATARTEHTATLLPSGQVLVAGGYTGGQTVASVELYDPATGSWKAAVPLTIKRQWHTATLLPSGQVLVVGGYSGVDLASAELYTACTSSAICQFLASGECEVGLCDLSTATCLATQKLDGAPCSKGVCIAGGCFPDSPTTASSSGSTTTTTSTATATTGASTGGGAEPSTSSISATSSTTTAGTGGSAPAAGAGGQPADIRLHGGGGCGCKLTPGAATEGAPWLVGAALLLFRRRRAGRFPARP